MHRMTRWLPLTLLLACGTGPQVSEPVIRFTPHYDQVSSFCLYVPYTLSVTASPPDTVYYLVKWLDPGAGAGSDVLALESGRADPAQTSTLGLFIATYLNTAVQVEAQTAHGIADTARLYVVGPEDFVSLMDTVPACAWLRDLL